MGPRSPRELRNDGGARTRKLDRGEVFVVTCKGVPPGELRPAGQRSVGRDLLCDTFGSAPAIDAERSRDDVDDLVDQSPEPRT